MSHQNQIQKESKPQINLEKDSRQLAVYGIEAQGKLMAMRIFIHGLTGVGIEVAKNIILAGPKQVTLYDPNIVTIQDVGKNFYCNQSHVGKLSRAQACLEQLNDLNPNVIIKITDNITPQYISSNFDCVVVLDNYDKQYLISLNKFCRSKNVGFIYAGNLGLYGFAFVDFGDKHLVSDVNGEEPRQIHISLITSQQKGIVYLHQGKKHGLTDGDTVVFKQVQGMKQLNDKQFKVRVIAPDSFQIGNTKNFSQYENGGYVLQVKIPTVMNFSDLQKSLRYPYAPGLKQMPIASWQKFGVPEQLHVILNGVLQFYNENKRLPNTLNQEDANKLIYLVKSYQDKKMDIEGQQFKVNQISEQLIKNVALYAQTQISPCCSFWGGLIAQQVIKLTGKYSPLHQWLHHQFFELLPTQNRQRTFKNTRYDDYVALFGDQFVQKVAKTNTFIVGAGALGCQLIKMFALMGAATNQSGKIWVTDDDHIQISNLNRQFLFRKYHIGKNKCETACQQGRKMNSSTIFEPLKLKVGKDSQQFFNDKFWTGLDFVVNAVDNVHARKYIDDQCVWYQKPLFESGTLGTKCHSQIILPHKTLSYNDIIDPPQQSFAICTVKLFPYQIQHTIQYARQYFAGNFQEPSTELIKFYQEGSKFLINIQNQFKLNPSISKNKLQTLKRLFELNQNKSYEKCVELVVNLFQQCFNHQIAQLIDCYPQNHVEEKTGKLFWTGFKKYPQVLKLNLEDPKILQFVQAGANIYATMIGLPIVSDKSIVAKIAKNVKIADYVPKKTKIQIEEGNQANNNKVQINVDDQITVQNIIAELSNLKIDKSHTPKVIQFQKDDPTNWHIQFIGGISNLRARNYHIEEQDNFKIKLIAGKIIPAIATTTALVVGAVGIQIMKLILNKPAQVFKNISVNLALPLLVFNDPLQPILNEDKQFDATLNGPIKVVPGKFTKWDSLKIKGPLTVQQLKNHFQKTYGVQISMITYGTSTIYMSFGAMSKKTINLRVEDAISQTMKIDLPKWKKIICIGMSGNTSNGVDCVFPAVKYEV